MSAARRALIEVARILHEAGWDKEPTRSNLEGLTVSEAAKQKLVELAARRSTPDHKVSPEQVAAQLLEEAVATAT